MARATTTVERTTVLTHPPTMVFAVVCSPETAPLIDPAVREWSADVRPIAVGTRFTIRGHLGRLPIRGRSQVVTWAPPRLAELRSLTPRWPLSMAVRHQFDERPDGGTAYTWSITFQETSVLARPVIPIAARLFERAFAEQAEALTRYLDALPDDAVPPRL